jgi:hypothetical protein
MSVDESREYEHQPEVFTERLTNSFNLAVDMRDSSLIPKMAAFDNEDQVRFTASPQTSKRTSEQQSEDTTKIESKRTEKRINFVTPTILSQT